MFKCFFGNSCLSVSTNLFGVEKDLMQLPRKFLPSNKLVPLVADVTTQHKQERQKGNSVGRALSEKYAQRCT